MSRAILLGLSLLLSGCFQAQLNGSVAGAQITVTDLNDPTQVHASAVTWDRAYMETYRGGRIWGRANDFKKLLWIGIFNLELQGLDDNSYYLVTASGGGDADADRDNRIDAVDTPIQGEWHAIMSGAELKLVGPKVTALTEAVYQWLRPELDQLNLAQLGYNLERAAAQVISDIDGDEDADWTDALNWNRQIYADAFRGDLDTVNLIADNVTVNGSEDERRELAFALLGIEPTDQTNATPEVWFNDHIAGPVLDFACQSCHVPGGPSENTRLVFVQRGAENEDARNQEIFANFLTEVEGGGQLVLSKVQGVDHGGGSWFTSQSEGYQSLATYIYLVTGDDDILRGPIGDFWNGVTMADARQTLRRAALIFAGRLPTDAEYEQAESGESGLRAVIRGLMTGEGFHQFLLRGANDRLHTDAFLNGLFMEVGDLNATSFYPVGSNKYSSDRPSTDEEWAEKWRWERAWQMGLARAPLELIAYVVENDRPYSEILTADYTMVNWQSSEILRSDADFGNREVDAEFLPGRNLGQIVMDDSLVSEFFFDIGTIVYSHGSYVDYPHAGVLNTQAFLARYPTTETNRNRARARWTYLHFLDVDIEKSAPRTTDPDALADTNNPTMNNSACTVCHQVMDPVAGAYQNYGNEGWYRSAWGGRDSLPETYKYPEWFDENADPSPYREGDTWFRDMRSPGLPGQTAPNNANSLQWLAAQIVADPRFARATVKFWWPAVMGSAVLQAPGSPTDTGYQQLLRAFEQQTEDVDTLAQEFSNDGFDLKELLVDMALSGWFRANGVEAGAASGRELELEAVGTGRLLTPEELENKTRAITGTAWGEGPAEWLSDGVYSTLDDRLRIYYGGIDSFGVKERARQMTSLMSNVALRQAVEHACYAVVEDFGRSDNQRLLFGGMSAETTPGEEGRRSYAVAADYASRGDSNLDLELAPGDKRLRISFDNAYWDEASERGNNLVIDSIRVLRNGNVIASFEGEEFRDTPGFEQRRDFWEGAYHDSGDVHWEEVAPDVWEEVGWVIWGWRGWISLPLNITEAGSYRVEVRAYGPRVPDNVAVAMTATVTDTDPYGQARGSEALREKIAELYGLTLGEELPADDPEIEAVYQLLVETWQAREERWPGGGSVWYWPDDECFMAGDFWERDQAVIDSLLSDPANMKGSWVSVMMYLMTHFSYLHE